jgi:hypothetical protein
VYLTAPLPEVVTDEILVAPERNLFPLDFFTAVTGAAAFLVWNICVNKKNA